MTLRSHFGCGKTVSQMHDVRTFDILSSMKIEGFADTIRWYDQNAREYAESSYKVTPATLINRFIELLPPNPVILDAGCGAGKDSRVFNKLGARVTGIDLSKGLIKEARKRNPTVNFEEGNFLNLRFENASFDGVWAHASLVHLETINDAKKALDEFRRVLRDGGLMHVYVKAQLGENKTEVVKDPLSNHERFFRYYTEDELKRLVSDASFQIIETEMQDDLHGREDVKWIALFARKGRVKSSSAS